MRRIVPHAAALALTAVLAAPAAAQDGGPVRSLAFGAGESTTIGYFQRLSPRTEVGVEVGLHRSTLEIADEELTSTLAQVLPIVKLRGSQVGLFVPYTWLAAGVSLNRQTAENGIGEGSATQWGGVGQAAFGLEWLPTRAVSIGAHAGVALRYDTVELASNGNGDDSSSWNASTFNSGVRVQIHF